MSRDAKAVAYKLTPQGVLIKTSGSNEQAGAFDGKLVSYEKQLRTMDPEYAHSVAIHKMQILLDEVQRSRSRPPSCKAGCSACCHQKVDIGPFEATLIEGQLNTNVREIHRESLARQVKALKSGPGGFEKLPFAERRCVFLSTEQTCSIYSVRPLMCRRHFVQSDPALCRSEEYHRLEMEVNIDTDAYLSAYVTRHATQSLPEFVQDWLNRSE